MKISTFCIISMLLLVVSATISGQKPSPSPSASAAPTASATPIVSVSPLPSPTPTKTFDPKCLDYVRVIEVYNGSYRYPDKKASNTDKSSQNKTDVDKKPPVENCSENDNTFGKTSPDSNTDKEKGRAGLNDIIIVRVKYLEALLKKADCQPPFYQMPCSPKQEIFLFIDGRALKGLRPESAPTLDDRVSEIIPRSGELRYHLKRDADLDANQLDMLEHWADLLGFNFDDDVLRGSLKRITDRPVEVSVGLSDLSPVQTDVKEDQRFNLVRLRLARLPFWLIFFAVFIYFLWWLAKHSDLLRDRTPIVWGRYNRKPYSLGAVQAAWWLFLIVLSFISVWLVTNEYDLSTTALILLSIGFGTALSGVVVSANKRSPGGNGGGVQAKAEKLTNLLAEKRQIENLLDEYVRDNTKTDLFNQTKTAYDSLIKEIRQTFPTALGPWSSGRFWKDILSDNDGVSFHRFQMVVWSIILGVFFVVSALGRLAMPQFSTTLLALMGISAGTFVGFKITENGGAPTAGTTPLGSGVDDDKPENQQLPDGQKPALPGARANALSPAGGGDKPADNDSSITTTTDNSTSEAPVSCVIEPPNGSVDGGATVTITETGFDSVKSVIFGDKPATDFSDVKAGVITATIPERQEEGPVKVTVENNTGKKAQADFTYLGD